MREIILLLTFFSGLVLIIYAAVMAGVQYNLPWLPALVSGGIGIVCARILSQGMR